MNVNYTEIGLFFKRANLRGQSQSPIFPLDRHDIGRLTINGRHLDFDCTVPWGRASGIIALGGGGREK